VLEHFYKSTEWIQHLRRSYLADILEEMAAIYHEWGSSRANTTTRFRGTYYFGEWMRENVISPKKVTPEDVDRFSAQFVPPLRKDRFHKNSYDGGLKAGVNMALKLLRQKYPPKASFIDREITSYTEFLRQKRALADNSVANHVFTIRPFLEAMFGKGPIRPGRVEPNDVHRYVLKQRDRHSLETVLGRNGQLRSFFRYWTLTGYDSKRLLGAIPKFRVQQRCLPHAIINEEDYDTLYSAFDRTTATGRRDYAAVRCMADLGMRVGDVTILTLDDINWRKGEIRIPNAKEGMPLWLPLPEALGEALADYVRHGRPKSTSRVIFLRHVTPCWAPYSNGMIRAAFRKASKRAGLPGKCGGTHTLRHSLATHLRRSKAPVKDMADVLGHRALQSTTAYAQIDLPALRAVAQPWPEGGQ